MGGRYRLARKKEILAGHFDVENDIRLERRYDVAPGQDVAVIRQDTTRPIRSFSLTRQESSVPGSNPFEAGSDDFLHDQRNDRIGRSCPAG